MVGDLGILEIVDHRAAGGVCANALCIDDVLVKALPKSSNSFSSCVLVATHQVAVTPRAFEEKPLALWPGP